MSLTSRLHDMQRTYIDPQLQQRDRRSTALQGQADAALADPTGQAGIYQDYYQKAADAFTAPAMRDFTQTQSRLGANVASRFGGNASGEEIRQTNQAGDVFSRNLTEALAGLAPQAAAAGQRHTDQLVGAANASTTDADQLRQIMLQNILGMAQQKPSGGGILGAIGGIGGGIIGGLLGGPAGAAAGAGVGSNLSGFGGG